MTETRRDALRRGAEILRDAGIENPRLEARLLLAQALGLAPTALLAEPNASSVPGYDTLLARRAAREPLALILGRREFWSLAIAVSPATLIPRADSETLIEAALTAFPDRAAVRRILDLGTGTGCLLLAALTEFSDAFGVGVDIAPAAAVLAAANAALLGLASRAAFFVGDWAAAVSEKFDLVLCNPPYIASADLPGLMPEVACYEPARALDGGPDGLVAYRRILADLPRLLTPAGAAILELGIGQESSVPAMAASAGFATARRPDLAGIPRALVLRRASLEENGSA